LHCSASGTKRKHKRIRAADAKFTRAKKIQKKQLEGLEKSKGLKPRPRGYGGTTKVGSKLTGTFPYSVTGEVRTPKAIATSAKNHKDKLF